ncbi:type III-B CRISPR module RAMP protein Cmr6 [Tepidibacter thalassicus]|uniref:RAMP superfamily protein n=1 Tax=Tepidibacter thalassicus DSM 15285 TaxID=1123350 RepID=A0A1M5TSZ4_9FIRM|nr:type III-B CRISPR module RAMP protein Cmr6 [Tepidibacter thalassicus]SHH53897.1 RAMP superfamily protein [Tepidibacter thalassicus DSM 15285]
MVNIKELLDNKIKKKLEKEYGIKEQDDKKKNKNTKTKQILKENYLYLNMKCYRNCDVNKNKDIKDKEKEVKKNSLCKNIKIPTINGKKEIENFNLMYNKLLYYNCKKDKVKPCNLTVETITYYDEKISKYLRNKTSMLTNLGYKKIIKNLTISLYSSMVIGLGEVSVWETSIKLDYLYGIPYIPASTIKGAYRNFMENDYMLYKKDRSKKVYYDDIIDKLFGTEEKEGKLIFTDIYPEKGFKIAKDIINPHYSDYYSENKAPMDDKKPKPIFFITIKEAKFKFNLFIKEEVCKDVEKIIRNSFSKFLDNEALGAKKAVGYGYFEVEGSNDDGKED